MLRWAPCVCIGFYRRLKDTDTKETLGDGVEVVAIMIFQFKPADTNGFVW